MAARHVGRLAVRLCGLGDRAGSSESVQVAQVLGDGTEDPRSCSPGFIGARYYVTCQVCLFVSLLVSNVWQRITFKNLGYSLGDYPLFVLLSISGAFVVIFGSICAAIKSLTGGWLPETRTLHSGLAFSAIGFCNALQGLGMVLANPHVPGNLQALLQQAVIPFTLATSAVRLGAQFSKQQYAGMLLIVFGIALQLAPSTISSDGAALSGIHEGSLGWVFLFLSAQFPVALAAVLQEQAFQAVPVNVFQMMFGASVAQFTTLLVMAMVMDPFRERSLDGALEDVLHQASDPEALGQLLACVFAMLLAQLSQALMVKYSSAAFAVLCMAFVVPSAAVAFTMPELVGIGHTEQLQGTAPAALGLVFTGILCYRLGDATVDAVDTLRREVSTALSTGLLDKSDGHRPRTPVERPVDRQSSERSAAPSPDRSARPTPQICTSGVGIIQSEYSAARESPLEIWEECTLRELPFMHRSVSEVWPPQTTPPPTV